MKIVPPFSALLLCGTLVAAQSTAPDPAPEIASFEAGVICPPEPVGTATAPDTVTGYTNIIDEEPPFVSTGQRVPAVLGIGFGVKAQSAAQEGLDDVTIVVSHPPLGANGVTAQSYATTISGVVPSLTFYQFDFPYELVFGTWRLTALRADEILYETTFQVVPPNQVPELASICGFDQLLS